MIIKWSTIKTYIMYNWWKFLIVSLAIVLVWSVAINEIIQPNENEKIVISAINVEINKEKLEVDGVIFMEDYQNQNIKAIFIETIQLEGPEFQEFIATRSLPGTDLIFLPRSSILENMASYLFLPLDEQVVINYFGQDIEYYYEDDVLYGIRLTYPLYESIFASYLTGIETEDYFVFINSYSRNIGSLNDESKENEEAALEFLRWLMSEA